MSNSTRQGGYDERLVVPLEASRRGAHRARTNPLVAALPLLVVVIVVAAVIGVAYMLFLKPSSDPSASDPLTSPTTPGATSAPSATTKPTTTASKSSSASNSSSSPAAAAVNTNISITVYNGTGVTGLAKRVATALNSKGFPKAQGIKGGWAETVSQTTVFYSKDSQAATAAAVVKALGFGKAQHTTASTGGGLVVEAMADADSKVQ
jgi:hypothetical protein